jgi:hypothetical protein
VITPRKAQAGFFGKLNYGSYLRFVAFSEKCRPKTGIQRRCPLWPETITSIREWLVVRPKPSLDKPRFDKLSQLLFLTAKADSWSKATSDNPISKETR